MNSEIPDEEEWAFEFWDTRPWGVFKALEEGAGVWASLMIKMLTFEEAFAKLKEQQSTYRRLRQMAAGREKVNLDGVDVEAVRLVTLRIRNIRTNDIIMGDIV